MPEKDDHLSNEVSLALAIKETGIKGATKSRAIAAFDRLVGAAIDIPTAFLEAKAIKIRDSSIQSVAIEQFPVLEAEGQSSSALVDDQKVRDALEQKELRQLGNKKAVVDHSLKELTQIELETDEDIDELAPEWLDFFAEYAEKASSADYRILWARILAGEIRKPGLFSLGTLRVLSEIGPETAQLFEKYALVRLGKHEILKEENIVGRDLFELIELEEAGLLKEVTGNLHSSMPVSDGSSYKVGDNIILILKSKDHSRKEFNLPIIKITRVGQELCAILPKIDESDYLVRTANYLFSKGEITKATLARVIERTYDGDIEYKKIRDLKSPVQKEN
ncbi:MAG: DUF2806 domain-containing protein [Paracoccaceae bacterium]|nr:DUF2806 domain-containing protein [Paracoccaceae bacterium]